MAEDEDENIIKKAEEDKGDIRAGEENPPIGDPEENLRLKKQQGKWLTKMRSLAIPYRSIILQNMSLQE